MSSQPPIVEIRGLSKRFKDKQALDQVSLAIQPGRIIGLLGANAAGKSTLLRHIIGLYLPDQGTCTTLALRPQNSVRRNWPGSGTYTRRAS